MRVRIRTIPNDPGDMKFHVCLRSRALSRVSVHTKKSHHGARDVTRRSARPSLCRTSTAAGSARPLLLMRRAALTRAATALAARRAHCSRVVVLTAAPRRSPRAAATTPGRSITALAMRTRRSARPSLRRTSTAVGSARPLLLMQRTAPTRAATALAARRARCSRDVMRAA